MGTPGKGGQRADYQSLEHRQIGLTGSNDREPALRFAFTLLSSATALKAICLARTILAHCGWYDDGADRLFTLWTMPVRAGVAICVIRAFVMFMHDFSRKDHEEE